VTNAANARQQYARDAILSASPARLLTMLYDRLLLDLRRAEAAQEAADWQTANSQLLHAQDIITELSSTLRPDVWDGAEGLRGLYEYVRMALVNANIHRDVARTFLPQVAAALFQAKVQLRVDAATRTALGSLGASHPSLVAPASEADYRTEFLDLVLAVKVVDGVDAAIEHIETHGSHHTDTIVTQDAAIAEKFLNGVDSAVVLWNASTRFNDGHQFGFGAEIGISTDKLHARGPMGLEELTSYKYVVRGAGQVRS